MSDAGRFHTRQYTWRPRGVEADASVETPLVLPPGVLHRFILGRDVKPVAMTNDDIDARLHDPFASLLLRRGTFPLTLKDLLRALDKLNASTGGVPSQRTFIVAEGGQIRWTAETSKLDRGVRLVVARGAAEGLPSLFVSTSTETDSPSTFLQVLTWDDVASNFQWYDRRGGTWIWAGNSFDALPDDSRGQGPFDSHVNGALNMKELKVPWIHWHSQNASIGPEAFRPGDPFVTSDLYLNRSGAEDLERQIVRPGIFRWNAARFSSRTNANVLQRLPEFFRQVLSTTTVNLAASAQASSQLKAGDRFILPFTLFVDIDGLINELDLLDDLDPIEVDGAAYLAALTKFDVALRDDESGFVQSGDAFFACVVPERAFEDQVVLHALLSKDDGSKRVLSDRLAACMLMVDFSNPVFSARREALLKYVPSTATLANPRALEESFIGAVTNAAISDGSAEAEFLANWAVPDDQWRKVFAKRIRDYMVAAALAVTNRFDDIFRLIDSRRREFRRRPLAEFSLTVPSSNISRDAPFVEIGIDARIRDKPSQGAQIMALAQFDPPGFADDLNVAQKAAWSKWISDELTAARERTDPGLANYGPRLQFFNPLTQPPAADAVEKDITWTAFPRLIEVTSAGDKQRWKRADASRDVQDEYCEWSMTRDPTTNKLTRVTFTCEGPEYWKFLAKANPAKLLELYRTHVSPDVAISDLFTGNVYNTRNRWNNSTTEGVMHLIQQANTLGAEIELAAGASIVRLKGGIPLNSEPDLIACGAYGEPKRHSDPHIGAVVNELCRGRADVTLANPIGLYIDKLSVDGWVTPDGADPLTFWSIARGTPKKTLRAVFEVPAGRGYVVGDIRINGNSIDFGAQIADHITMKLTGMATRLNQSTVAPMNGCVAAAGEADAGEQSVAAALQARRRVGR